VASFHSSENTQHGGPRSGAGRRSDTQLPPGFETEETSARRWQELIDRLDDRRGSARRLANVLRRCGGPAPCGLEACPKCARDFRLRLHRQGQAIVPPDAEFLVVSLIPRSNRVELDQLPAFDLATWARSRQRGLARALPVDSMFIGGIDISLNTWENADPHWCFHVYGFIVLLAGWGVENKRRRLALRSAIAEHNPLAEPVYGRPKERPLLMKRCVRTGFDDNLLYGYKSGFYLRSRYSYQKQSATTLSSNVVSHALPVERQVELAMFLSGYRTGSRLLLVGLRRQGIDAIFRLTRPQVASRRE